MPAPSSSITVDQSEVAGVQPTSVAEDLDPVYDLLEFVRLNVASMAVVLTFSPD